MIKSGDKVKANDKDENVIKRVISRLFNLQCPFYETWLYPKLDLIFRSQLKAQFGVEAFLSLSQQI